MQVLTLPWGTMHVHNSGQDGPPVVFANSLGTDLRLWDAVLPMLPAGLRMIRYDKRGHGLSDCGGAADIADLAQDAIALIEALAHRPVVFVGLSIGGLIAQEVADRRPDLVRALVLSNTAARIGTPDIWAARIAAVEVGGLGSIADAVMERWFAPEFRASLHARPWRNMLTRTPVAGYTAACAAIAGADLSAQTAALRLPTQVIAGECDGATPPDLVQATAALIPGATFHVIPGAGHLPPVETPRAFAALLTPFLQEHCR